jgi:hypothetical protein
MGMVNLLADAFYGFLLVIFMALGAPLLKLAARLTAPR